MLYGILNVTNNLSENQYMTIENQVNQYSSTKNNYDSYKNSLHNRKYK